VIRYRSLGAAGYMGASGHLVVVDGAAVVLDAGRDPRAGTTTALGPAQSAGARAVVLSHAHLDHAGGLPILMRGLPGVRVTTTPATRALVDLALVDHLRRCRAQAGATGLPFSDGERRSLPWDERPFGQPASLWPDGPVCTLLPAGHLTGSAGVLLEKGGRRVFYTGDVHLAARAWQTGARWPTERVDVLIVESTQGANAALDGTTQPDLEATLVDALGAALSAGGRVLLPVFAFGKAQEMLVLIERARARGALPAVPIYLSGLARAVTRACAGHADPAEGDVDALRAALQRCRPLTPDVAERPSPEPALFLAGSGMLGDGSLSHGLADRLGQRAGDSVFFVGYLDPETPGYELRAGVSVADDERKGPVVRAFPFSAHAGRMDLVAAIVRLAPRDVVLVHGDGPSREALTHVLAASGASLRIHRPEPGETLTFGEA
jgi:Cft2 family RNA processing exonuclease